MDWLKGRRNAQDRVSDSPLLTFMTFLSFGIIVNFPWTSFFSKKGPTVNPTYPLYAPMLVCLLKSVGSETSCICCQKICISKVSLIIDFIFY